MCFGTPPLYGSADVSAKEVIQDGFVSVNGEVETRRGRKLYPNDVVSYEENELTLSLIHI